jgi:hypothetical protein
VERILGDEKRVQLLQAIAEAGEVVAIPYLVQYLFSADQVSAETARTIALLTRLASSEQRLGLDEELRSHWSSGWSSPFGSWRSPRVDWRFPIY